MGDHPSPVVFISYSHDDADHDKRVLGLAQRLRRDGYETLLDQYVNGSPPEGWPRWMLDRLDEATHVLVVCTPTYYRRFRGHEVPDRGKGVDWEGARITQAIYDSRSKTTRFIPIVFRPEDVASIPEPLRGLSHHLLDSQQSYEHLLDQLQGAAGVVPLPVGRPVPRVPRDAAALEFGEPMRDGHAAGDTGAADRQNVAAPESSTTTPVFVGPTERGPLEPQLIIGWDDFLNTYGQPLPAEVSYLAHAVRGFFDNGGGRTYVVRVVGSGATAARGAVASAKGGEAFGFEALSVGAWGNRLGLRVRKGARVGIRVSVLAKATDAVAETEHMLEDWDNLSLDPAAPNFALNIRSRWLQFVDGPLQLDPVADGRTVWLAGGSDGAPPTAEDYLGGWPPEEATSGLRSTFGYEDVALICVPDHVHENLAADDRKRLALEAVAMSHRLRDRFTLLSTERGLAAPESISTFCDSAFAAVYAPFVRVAEPGGTGCAWIPATGHVAGVIARSDFEHGIHHAPTDEVVRCLVPDAEGRALECAYDDVQLDELSRLGVNALAEARGGDIVTRSSLTTSTVAQYQSLAAQRYLAWIVATIVRGTRWARFEPNDEALWRRLTEDIEDFLRSEWEAGGLLGSSPAEAFVVKCGQETTTQNDVDNGRAIVQICLALANAPNVAKLPPLTIQAGKPPGN